MMDRGPFEVHLKKSRTSLDETLPKADTLSEAVRQARRWLYANGFRSKSRAVVYDLKSGLREFSTKVDARGEVMQLWSRTREGMWAFHEKR
jgi:hypothetical protein